MGFIPNNIFIPIAEKEGLLSDIGKWTIKQACLQVKAWQDSKLPPVKISINVSIAQLEEPNLLPYIHQVTEKAQISPSCLELEIRESHMIQNKENIQVLLADIVNMGITICLDDFGTGYSSLVHLSNFPFNTLKTDINAIYNPQFDEIKNITVIDFILALGKGLNIDIVPKGVESHEIYNLLKSRECKYMQGNFLCKPLSVKNMTLKLKQNYSQTLK